MEVNVSKNARLVLVIVHPIWPKAVQGSYTGYGTGHMLHEHTTQKR